jgi:ABC-type transporter Mla subunit MlaD
MTERRAKKDLKPAARLSDFSARVARHRIPLGLLVLAVGGFLAYIAWVSVNGVPFQDRYKLEAVIPGDAPIVKPGGSVRMAGRLAGTITEVETEGGDSRVTMELRPQFAPIGEDATARVRVRSIVYLTYVEIDPGNREDPMAEGGTIPLERTGAGVDLLRVVDLFDRRTRDLLADSVVNLGEGLAGRGEGLNEGLGRLEPALRQAVPQLQALTAEPGALGRGIAGAAGISRGLRGDGPGDAGGLIESGDAALGAIASRHDALGEGIARLRPFEDQFLKTAPLADPVLADVGVLARELEPAAKDLRAGLPKFARLLSRGEPLSRESGLIDTAARPVIELTGPALYDLWPIVTAFGPISTPLDRIIEVLAPYENDITIAGDNVVSATTRPYPQGQTAPNNPALRFIPIIGCAHARNPYPEPGEALEDSERC